MMDIESIFQICEWVGTAAFAVSGAMVAIRKRTDLFGVLLMALFTAMGGGTLRDVLIGRFPPRMFTSYPYVLLSIACALIVFLLARILGDAYRMREQRIEQINNVFDAVGLGIFAVSGARIGMEAGYGDNVLLMVSLGMITAVGGGMMRDVLLQEMPFVLKKHVYAVAAIAGALCYVFLCGEGMEQTVSFSMGCVLTIIIRLLATHYRWNLPKAF